MKTDLTLSGFKRVTVGAEVFTRSDYNYKELNAETLDETLELIKAEIIAQLDKIKLGYDETQIVPGSIEIKAVIN